MTRRFRRSRRSRVASNKRFNPTPEVSRRLQVRHVRAKRNTFDAPQDRLALLLPRGYTRGMKTAISIPDEVFAEADRLAQKLKQSRSQLYSCAVREYVARHSDDDVTAALDALYAQEAPADDAFRVAAAKRTLERSEW
jgi:predicted transcriptional regulator